MQEHDKSDAEEDAIEVAAKKQEKWSGSCKGRGGKCSSNKKIDKDIAGIRVEKKEDTGGTKRLENVVEVEVE